MIELIDQFALVDDVGEADARGPVDELESHPALAVQLPDHLQHQKLIEIRIEQRAHDRVDAERVVVNAGGEIGDHGGELRGRGGGDKGGGTKSRSKNDSSCSLTVIARERSDEAIQPEL